MAHAVASQLRTIGSVAAENLALALNLSKDHVGTIERAIADEINAMSAHFTMSVSDVQTHYESELVRIKSAFTFVNANVGKVIAVAAAVFVFGVLVGRFA